MSIRNLDLIFHPASVALIGASARANSVGAVMTKNMLASGFSGPIMLVNPSHPEIEGHAVYRDVASLPAAPDLAVICTPAPTVPGLIADLATRGTKAAVVVTAGFKELGSAEGERLQQAMLDAARPHLLRIIGPNGIGILSTPSSVNASFAHLAPQKGDIAFVAQSGAILTTILDWSAARGIGFSHLVSLGDMVDVDFGDMLDYLANDKATRAILLYAEAVTEARKFMSAARAAARTKPVIVIKAGRHAAAAKAALSHTGALAGADAVYDAAFRRVGLLRVNSLDELFDAVETLATTRAPSDERLAILTNGGGLGVLATDALLDRGGSLAELSKATVDALSARLPATWSKSNPVDIIGDAPAQRYADALDILLAAPEVGAVLVLNCPTAIASGTEAAVAVAERAVRAQKPVLTSWVGEVAASSSRAVFTKARVATSETPDKAVDGFMHLVHFRQSQRQLMEAPRSTPEFPCNRAAGRALASAALHEGQQWLDEITLGQLLADYGIAAPRAEIGADENVAADIAARIGGKVALKIHSPDITHKSDVGGVALGLWGAVAVRAAAKEMRGRVSELAPKAKITGFLVQEMIERPRAHELIIGMTVDRLFGPVMLFGHGGTAVEVIQDKALGLAPLNSALAQDMIARTRVFRELKGYRDRKPANLDAIAATLVKLSQLACDIDEIQEIEINPLLADENGVIALDARARIAPLADGYVRGKRLAISPYPCDLERTERLAKLGDIFVRPIRPEDDVAIDAFASKIAPEDARLRFFTALRELPRPLKARLTQIDYDREMAFVAIDPGSKNFLGIGRIAADPDNEKAEFAVIVRSDLKGKGLGWFLMQRLISYSRDRGIKHLFGDMLATNNTMIAMCRQLGFSFTTPADAALLRAQLDFS
jgi:acetyltransferase